MVKVVGRDESVVKRITCKSCASILEYTLTEVKSRHLHISQVDPHDAEWVDCPNCGNKAIIRS
jgi:predicted RNA-binding Zn-ribbon protein involved in translation (DUF1610 family)